VKIQLLELLLAFKKIKPPHPCPPRNPHCQPAVSLDIDQWVVFGMIFAVGLIIYYTKNKK